jgi:protein HIRA/HIR1
MVVAEVPLWVVHSNASTPSGGASAAKNPKGGGGGPASTEATTAIQDHTASAAARASESLLLLDGSAASGGGLQKAAIYSVDVHGSRFATGGGDGTVRIWNAGALFPKPKTLIKSHYRRVVGIDTNTNTNNNNNTNTNNNNDTTMDGMDVNNGTMATTNTLHTNATGSTNAAAAAGNQYESSGESSQDETISGNSLPSSPSNNININASTDPIRDLSSVVRKKGEASSSSSSKMTSQPPASQPPASQQPPPSKASQAAVITNDNDNDDDDNDSDNDDNNKFNNNNKITHKHRLLCTLSAHTGSSVLAVRFSNSGKYLASAGDDAVVCIYARQSQSTGTGAMVARGNLEATSCTLEHWIRIKLCRGHGLDAVGLAWAPDDSHLVSCSLDSNTPIIVWKLTDLADDSYNNARNNNNNNNTTEHHHNHFYNNVLCNPYKILGKGVHTSTVKGVTFDPAGTYLASSGDDPSVCIWRAHDDWGLEQRIDAKSGIFRKWNNSSGGGGGGGGHNGVSSAAATGLALSSQSLFRRLSWSTDGAYICATNAVVKNKNVASTISREGWAVSSSKSTATGAVNLVGHKQPVVAACHCPYLLDAGSPKANDDNDNADGDDNDNDGEPDYSTLLALGDKRGFVTVWSTRKARPIFKIQCSETRCTVTDLSWGRLPVEHERGSSSDSATDTKSHLGDLMLLVSLLDGQVVALRFGIPDEFGKLLSAKEQARVFQLRYGIDLHDANTLGGGRRLFVGDNSGRPKLIENALQFSLEHSHLNRDDDDEDDEDDENESENRRLELEEARRQETMTSEEIRRKQLESRSKGGKKRIQPLLMMQTTALPVAKKAKISNGEKQSKANKLADTLETAMELAEKAASGAAAVAAAQKFSSNKTTAAIVTANQAQIVAANSGNQQQQQQQQQQHAQQQQHQHQQHNSQSTPHHPSSNIQLLAGTQSTPQIPHSTDRIHSVDLPLSPTNIQGGGEGDTTEGGRVRYVADCTNSIRVPKGSSGSALPCTVLSISKGGCKLWNDQLLGSTCCAIASSESWLVVGTSDGSLQVYGTSPTLGWKSTNAFRSHPPFVLGRPIVALHLRQQQHDEKSATPTELLVVTSDGRFAVYGLEPRLKLKFKGSLLPAMTHMLLSADLETDLYLPKLARIQLTETNRLLLLLSLQSASNSQGGGRNFGNSDGGGGGAGRGANQSPSVGAGGSLQGFIYDRESDLWMRVADSRFVLSDFYNTLPSFSSSKKAASPKGELSRLDDSVRMGATSSTLQRSRKSRSVLLGSNNQSSYQTTTSTTTRNDDGTSNDVASRSHCEDRMACALALGSATEFEFWFSMYTKILSLTGNDSLLRLVIDMLLGKHGTIDGEEEEPAATTTACWWLSESSDVLGLNRVKLVRTVVIPEMSKNRALQRITNEIAIEVEGLGEE